MKCAKCGHEVDPSSPNCPYCAARDDRKTRNDVRCPQCGSDHIDDVPAGWWKAGSPGCLLSFSVLLLLLWLSLFGMPPRDRVCLDCGCRWGAPFFTWQRVLVLALGAVLLAAILYSVLPLLAAVLVLLGAVVVGSIVYRMLKD